MGGALAQATIAGLAAFVVLSILGVPSPLALALVVGMLDLIPLIGATIGALIVGLITVFTDFPTVTIIWFVFSIAYQQFENYVIQPRIQSKAVQLDPFIIVVAALFGAVLLGVIGALVAIPVCGGPADRHPRGAAPTGGASQRRVRTARRAGWRRAAGSGRRRRSSAWVGACGRIRGDGASIGSRIWVHM